MQIKTGDFFRYTEHPEIMTVYHNKLLIVQRKINNRLYACYIPEVNKYSDIPIERRIEQKKIKKVQYRPRILKRTYKVGDLVRFIREEIRCGMADSMYKCIGKIGKIIECSSSAYRVQFNNGQSPWTLSHDSLELVNNGKLPKKLRDGFNESSSAWDYNYWSARFNDLTTPFSYRNTSIFDMGDVYNQLNTILFSTNDSYVISSEQRNSGDANGD